MKENSQKMKTEIDLSQNKIYVVKDGVIEHVEAPGSGFGEHLLSWQHGKVNLIKEVNTRRI